MLDAGTEAALHVITGRAHEVIPTILQTEDQDVIQTLGPDVQFQTILS